MHSPKLEQAKKKPSTELDKLRIWVTNLNLCRQMNTTNTLYEEVERERDWKMSANVFKHIT